MSAKKYASGSLKRKQKAQKTLYQSKLPKIDSFFGKKKDDNGGIVLQCLIYQFFLSIYIYIFFHIDATRV